MSLNGFIRLRISNQMTQLLINTGPGDQGPGAAARRSCGGLGWNRVMACGISNQYFLSFITVTWTAHSILIENNLIKNLSVKRDWELWMRLLVRIHPLVMQLYISWAAAAHQLVRIHQLGCSCLLTSVSWSLHGPAAVKGDTVKEHLQ